MCNLLRSLVGRFGLQIDHLIPKSSISTKYKFKRRLHHRFDSGKYLIVVGNHIPNPQIVSQRNLFLLLRSLVLST